jgi:hypothetical protein
MADKPASRLGLAVLRHAVALGLSTGLAVVGSFAMPLWGFLVMAVGKVQPTGSLYEGPYLLPCICLISGGLFNGVVSLPVCLFVEWLLGDRGGLWWQLVFPTAILCVLLVSAAVVEALCILDIGTLALEEFMVPWVFFGGMCAIPVLAYWVTLAGLRFILERPMAAGSASQGGAAA